MGLSSDIVVTMSNFVGYMIEEAVRLGYRQIVLIGHPGKLVKIAAGIFHTHSHIADARMETLVAHLALLGAPMSCCKKSASATPPKRRWSTSTRRDSAICITIWRSVSASASCRTCALPKIPPVRRHYVFV
jgi:cobalamin biosynthesis protein CbiD